MSEKQQKTILATILVVSLILSVLFAWRVPFDGSNPDETSHLDYIRLLWEQKNFVRFTAGDPTYFETHQPPLYYLLCLPFYALSGGNVFVVRLCAALIQLGTIGLTFRATRDLFPSRPEVAIGAAAFVAFLPTQAQLSGAINNDGLTTFWSVAMFWRLGLLVRDGSGNDNKGALLLGTFFGLGLLTKLSVIQVVPAMFVAYLLAIRPRNLTPPSGKRVPTNSGGREWKLFPSALQHFALMMACGLLIASPWLIRNTLLYGDPLNITIFPQTAGPDPATPSKMMALFGWSWSDYWRTNAVRSFYTFWAILPPNAIKPQPLGLVSVLLLALGGTVGALRPPEQGGVKNGERQVVWLFLAGILLIVPFFVRFNMQFFQAQGRYFLPGLLPAAALCCLGWHNVLGKQQRYLGVGLVNGALLLLCVLQIFSYPGDSLRDSPS